MDFNFPIQTFHLFVPTFQQHHHMGYISVSLYDIPNMITQKLMNQGFLVVKLKSSLWQFYSYDFVNHYEISASQMAKDMFRLWKWQFGTFLMHDLSQLE